MAYVSVDVDVDLDDIDTDDLVEEICRRLKSAYRKKITDSQKIELKESFSELGKALLLTALDGIEIKTLDDEMKYEHLSNVFSKYTFPQIETLLP